MLWYNQCCGWWNAFYCLKMTVHQRAYDACTSNCREDIITNVIHKLCCCLNNLPIINVLHFLAYSASTVAMWNVSWSFVKLSYVVHMTVAAEFTGTQQNKTRKGGNCECIAAWGRGPPKAASVIPRFNWDAHAKFEVAKPIHGCLIAFLLLIPDIVVWPSPLTLWPWPWTFVMYQLWCGQTPNQIWTKSSNLWQNYCDFSIWRNDLEHVLHVAFSSGIIFTGFELGQPLHSCFSFDTR